MKKENEEIKKATKFLKTAKGQIDGILKMIENERYCIDISNQILASSALLKKANLLILKQHMNSCLVNAIHEDGGEEKIEELLMILSKTMGK